MASPNSYNCGECQPLAGGPPTTGLVIALTKGTTHRDLLPADNGLRTPTDCEFPLNCSPNAYDVYHGDLYAPDTKTQITPWTRPNITGCTGYDQGTNCDVDQPLTWAAIDNIDYVSGSSGMMTFDYVEDFREQPIIRADSWMGSEVETYVFNADIIVKPGATLTVESGATINLGNSVNIVVEEGGRLVIEPGVIMNMGEMSTLYAYGRLDVLGSASESVIFQRAASPKWYAIRLYGRGADNSRLEHVEIDAANYGIYMYNVDNISLNNVHVTGATYYGLYASSSSGGEIVNSRFEDAGLDGIYLYNSGLRLLGSHFVYNGRHGSRLYYASGVYYGGGGDRGYNVLTGNTSYGLYVYSASANLGEAPDIANPDGYAGYNSLYSNGAGDAYLAGGSNVMAEENWWGENPPNTAHFSVSNSTFDYSPWLTGDPNGPAKTQHLAGRKVEQESERAGTADDVALEHAVSSGDFIGRVFALRETHGRTQALEALTKLTLATHHPYVRLARVLRLGDLLHQKQADEAVRAGEALLRDSELTSDERRLVAETLFAAYAEELGQPEKASEMVDVIAASGPEEAELMMFQVELESGVIAEERGITDIPNAEHEELFSLGAAYPNPFNPRTVVPFTIGEEAHVLLEVFDGLGRRVAMLANNTFAPGTHEVILGGDHLASGFYFVRGEVRVGNALPHAITRMLTLVK